jgi:choline dehydrogenase-like flavoprotein
VTFNAGAIIVGAGAIGTPQLLHASGLHHPALGRYLTDHLNLVTRIYLDDEAPVDDLGQEWPINIYLPVSSGRPFHTAVLDIPSVAHAGVLANSAPGRTTDIGTFIGTEPREENRLVFDNTATDGFGLPAVRADVRLTELDHKNSEQAFTDQYTIARTLGQPWHGMSPQLRPFGSSLHLMGTHRIGTDEQSSVADQYGLLRGSENIYVVGNGVLGSRNSCNPTLTTVALALRTAEHLQQ